MDMLGVMGNLFVTTGHETEFGSATWWIYASISFGMVVFSGIMSGLTLGLMSLSLVELEVLQRSGSPTEKRQAAVIFPVVQRQHQLLVTLLFCNAIAMEALPIFLDKLFSPILAIVLSVSFVLAFGEVIPQAVCSRYGLAVGSNLVWLVRVLMILCWPIAYPIAKVLDLVLGHNKSAIFRRAQLKAFVSVHGLEAGKGGELTHDETTIINGALDLTLKTAEAAMTPIESTFTLDVNSKLDWEVMGRILARGHSRVPVFSGNPKNIIGLLLVKNLLTVRAENEIPVSSVSIRRIPKVPADMPLYDILNEFQKGGSHMAAVIKTKQKLKSNLEAEAKSHANLEDKENETHKKSVSFVNKFDTYIDIEKGKFECRAQDDNEDEVIGIITLEDVFEEILQEEIVDETDEYIDVHRRIRVVAAAVSSVVARSPSFRRLASLQKSQGAQGRQTTSSNYAKRKQLEEDGQKKENRSHAHTSDSLAKPLLGSNY